MLLASLLLDMQQTAGVRVRQLVAMDEIIIWKFRTLRMKTMDACHYHGSVSHALIYPGSELGAVSMLLLREIGAITRLCRSSSRTNTMLSRTI